MKELIEIVAIFVVVVFAMFIFILTPIAYFDGSAKSAFLKKHQGIEMPWYQATFINVEVNNAKVKFKEDIR